MRIINLLFLFLFTCSNVSGQNLKNTEWVKIKAERKDGSKIVDHLDSEKESLKYFFTEDTLLISTNEQYSIRQQYSIRNNIVSIGEFENYQIDSVSEAFLILTQVSKKEVANDKLNRYTFINIEYLFDYLKQNQQINIVGDSLINCDYLFSPTYKGSMGDLFYPILTKQTNMIFTGSFIISTDGKISNVLMVSNGKEAKEELQKLSRTLELTSGSWILPPTPKPFQFKIYLTLIFRELNPLLSFNMYFHKNNFVPVKSLTMQEITEADNHYNRGIRLFKNENFEKAAGEFNKCIKIDSLYTDAYYNLAYSYQKTGKSELACKTWEQLKEMGQIEGEKLFILNCK